MDPHVFDTQIIHIENTRGIVVGWGHYATVRNVTGSSPDEVIKFFSIT
jgi:hypothetical protein